MRICIWIFQRLNIYFGWTSECLEPCYCSCLSYLLNSDGVQENWCSNTLLSDEKKNPLITIEKSKTLLNLRKSDLDLGRKPKNESSPTFKQRLCYGLFGKYIWKCTMYSIIKQILKSVRLYGMVPWSEHSMAVCKWLFCVLCFAKLISCDLLSVTALKCLVIIFISGSLLILWSAFPLWTLQV